MKKLPKGVIIKDPQKTIKITNISDDIVNKLNLGTSDVVITNQTLKHIVERRDIRTDEFINSIPDILNNPTKIGDNSAKRINSFLFAKMDGKAKGVVLEVIKKPEGNQVVSAFPIDKKTYEKIVDISGRAEFPPFELAKGENSQQILSDVRKSTKDIIPPGKGLVKGEENKNTHKISPNGFTLIELLVVIGILGILVTLIMVSINGVKSKTQDAKRVWDLRIISTALELYYSDHGYYPYKTDSGKDLCLSSWYGSYSTADWTALVANNWSALLQDLRAHNYFSKVDLPGKMETDNSFLAKILPRVLAAGGSEKLQDPLYPKNYYTYGYMPSGGYNSYRLRAKLENLNFPALRGGLDGCFMYTDFCNDAPSGYNFEFGYAKSLGYFCLGPVGHYEAFDSGKPVIYLYPTEKQQISVKIWPKKIEKSEPLYNKGWQVTAYPDGTIINSSDGKNYPYLFWEGKSEVPNIERKTGFVVSHDKVNEFLAEKLASQGLKNKESKDFIEFWVPRLKKKNYVYVYFMPQADYDQLIPLKIEPKPDTVIRVYIFFKSLDEPIKVELQEFITPQRIGFTAVEWGGDRSEIR